MVALLKDTTTWLYMLACNVYRVSVSLVVVGQVVHEVIERFPEYRGYRLTASARNQHSVVG